MQNGVGYSSIPESRHLEHTLARNSGSGSFGQHLGGSGQLPLQHSAHGSGQLPLQHSAHGSGQFGISPSQSGQLGLSPRPSGQGSGTFGINGQGSGQLKLSPSQGSGQLLEQLLGQRRSSSLTASGGWQRNSGQFGSPHLSPGQNRSDSPFSLGSSQAFQPNGGQSLLLTECVKQPLFFSFRNHATHRQSVRHKGFCAHHIRLTCFGLAQNQNGSHRCLLPYTYSWASEAA